MSFRVIKFLICLDILNGQNNTEEFFQIISDQLKFHFSHMRYLKSKKTYLALKEDFENLPINEIKWPNELIPESGIFQTDPPIWTAIPILPKE